MKIILSYVFKYRILGEILANDYIYGYGKHDSLEHHEARAFRKKEKVC